MTHLSVHEVQMLVGEANVAFVLNMRLFEELDVLSGVEGARVRPLNEALAYFDIVTENEETNKENGNECPFLQKKKMPSKLPIVEEANKGRCPWPVVFCHDPAQGMRDFQTWVVLMLIVSYIYAKAVSYYS